MPEIKVNGININYELRGRGEPLVLIGGLSIDIVELEPVISELAGRFQVLAFDNRGSGLSDKPDELYSIGMMAEEAGHVRRRPSLSFPEPEGAAEIR